MSNPFVAIAAAESRVRVKIKSVFVFTNACPLARTHTPLSYTLTDAYFINFFSPRSLISICSLRIPFFFPFAVFVQTRQFYVFPSAALTDIRSSHRRFRRPSHGVVILAARSANRNSLEMASAAAAAAYNQNRRVPPTMQIQKVSEN